MKDLNTYIDHTLLKPAATPDDIVALCKEADTYDLFAVCVNSAYAYLAVNELEDSAVRVAATVGFPLGASSKSAKVAEAQWCVDQGVDEVDMVLNLGFLKAGLYKSVREEISAVKNVMDRRILKVIIETCDLTDDEKQMACTIAQKAGADFVKTSTGFGSGGATLADVILMRETVGQDMQVKASGGIKTREQAEAFIKAGANRIGTSSGVALVFPK